MRHSLLLVCFLVLRTVPAAGHAVNPITQAQESGSVLTNWNILSMVKAGLSADVIIAKIEASSCDCDTSLAALERLKSQGVPDSVISAMVKSPPFTGQKSLVSGGPEQVALTPTPVVGRPPFRLQDGTPVKLKLQGTISSATAHVGDRVDFAAVGDIKVDGVTVIPRGAVALATVTAAQAKRRMGRGGKLGVNIDYVRLTDSEKVPLRAVQDVNGGGHKGTVIGGMVATGVVFLPAAPLFLLVHGKDITIPEGTEVTAYVNGDIDLDPSRFNAATPVQPILQPPVPAGPALSSVEVDVKSSPDGADIMVDGQYAGSTPSRLNLAVGSHMVAVQRAGYAPWQRAVTITPGEQITISATLEKKPPSSTP